MSKKNKPETFVPEIEVSPDKPAKAKKKSSPGPVDPESGSGTFAGKVESLVLKSSGERPQVIVGLKGKRGKQALFSLDPSSAAFDAGLALVTAASISGAKLEVKPSGGGEIPGISEIELRVKRG